MATLGSRGIGCEYGNQLTLLFLFTIGSPWTPRIFWPTRQSWRSWREGETKKKNHLRYFLEQQKLSLFWELIINTILFKGPLGRPGLPGADGLPGPPGTVLMLPVSKLWLCVFLFIFLLLFQGLKHFLWFFYHSLVTFTAVLLITLTHVSQCVLGGRGFPMNPIANMLIGM